MKETRIIAVIPARGGSKGLPRKNIYELDGKPLIQHTIEIAKASKLLTSFVVSTEDNEIAAVAEKCGATVVMRPDELAQDNSASIDVLKHVLNHYKAKGEEFDILIMLEPTSPLRKDDDIDKAIGAFLKHGKADALVSLGEIGLEHPYITQVINEKGYLKPTIEVKEKFHQRQQLPTIYFPYGVVYLSKVDKLLELRSFYQEKSMPYFIERWQNYEIDDIYDMKAIEAIMRLRREMK